VIWLQYSKLMEYGNTLFTQTLKKIDRERRIKKELIVGFDTEFDSKTDELLSVQFSCGDNVKLYEINQKEFFWDDLWNLVLDFLDEVGIDYSHRKVRDIYLVCFWSIAELHHIRDLHTAGYIGENITYNVSKKFGSRYLHVLDLYQFFKGSLAKVAELFGYRKFDYDTSNITRADLKKKEFREYAVHDAFLTEKIYNDFRELIWSKYKVDILASKSVANTSMTIFRKNFLTEKVGNKRTKVRKLGLLCSWGGCNMAFVRGDFKGDFYLYDANSMYPNSAIQLGILPREKDWIFTSDLDEFLKGVGGICNVWFKFPENEKYPCLPVFNDGKLCYPLSGRSHCTLEEVRFALKCGAEIRLKESYYYIDGNSDLQEYLKELLRKKNSSKGVERAFYKLMMNSIIGKFTQKILKTDINDYMKHAQDFGVSFSELSGIKNLKLKKKVNTGSGFCPEWNTLILGYARATQNMAFRENNAYVGTTDSLVIKGEIKNKIVNGLDYEFEGKGKRLICLKTRVYALIDDDKNIIHLAHHGIHTRKGLVGLMEKGLVDGLALYDVDKIIKLRQSIRTEYDFGESVRKNMRFNGVWDDKRRLLDNGFTVPYNK